MVLVSSETVPPPPPRRHDLVSSETVPRPVHPLTAVPDISSHLRSHQHDDPCLLSVPTSASSAPSKSGPTCAGAAPIALTSGQTVVPAVLKAAVCRFLIRCQLLTICLSSSRPIFHSTQNTRRSLPVSVSDYIYSVSSLYFFQLYFYTLPRPQTCGTPVPKSELHRAIGRSLGQLILEKSLKLLLKMSHSKAKLHSILVRPRLRWGSFSAPRADPLAISRRVQVTLN